MDNENNQVPPPMQDPAPVSFSQTSPMPMEARKKEVGAIIGILIIVVVIVLGGLYVWGARLSKTPNIDVTTDLGPGGQTAEDIAAAQDPATDNLNRQGSSDELSAIEDDLDATPLNELDAEMSDITVELQ